VPVTGPLAPPAQTVRESLAPMGASVVSMPATADTVTSVVPAPLAMTDMPARDVGVLIPADLVTTTGSAPPTVAPAAGSRGTGLPFALDLAASVPVPSVAGSAVPAALLPVALALVVLASWRRLAALLVQIPSSLYLTVPVPPG
jgi:hypothetical protein